MRRCLTALITASFLPFTVGAVKAQEVHTPAPRIVCDQPVYDFGEADNDRVIEHTFILRNDGDLTLEIAGVRATCGCTATDVSQRMVPPGETTELTGKLNLRGRQGRQRQPIKVSSNDPNTPTLTLYIEGTAVTEVQMTPRQIFFGRITPDAVATGAVELVIQGQRQVRILKLEVGTPLLSVTNVLMADGVSQQIVVSTVPPLPKGAIRGTVRIETDSSTHPVLDLVVSGFVVGELTFAPHEIVLPEHPDKSEVRYLLCRSEGGKPFEIVSVDLPDAGMEAKIQSTGPNAYRIEVRNIRPLMDLNGQAIRVVTSLEDGKAFTVPFRIVPQSGQPASSP